MERLVTSSQAAEILGLSLQGVHYRIRTNKIKAVKKDGKTYVYISDEHEKIDEQIAQVKTTKKTVAEKETVVTVKDEQIKLLKKTIKWIKRQHASEIQRLEVNQNKIIEVFNSEIKLLQSAFNEMRAIYKPQIQQSDNQNNTHENSTFRTSKERYISLPNFTLYLKKNNKSDREIKTIILTAVKQKDERFIYNKKTKKILIIDSDFSDLL